MLPGSPFPPGQGAEGYAGDELGPYLAANQVVFNIPLSNESSRSCASSLHVSGASGQGNKNVNGGY